MTQRHKYLVFAAAVVLVPAAVLAGWLDLAPRYERRRQLERAEQAVAANNLARAEELLRGLTREAPDALRPQLLYAQVLRRLGRVGDAEAALQRAKALGLPDADARRESGLLLAAKGLPEAEEPLQQVLRERPDDAEVLRALARGYAMQRRWREADAAYTRCLEVHPNQTAVLFERGRSRLEAREFAKAAADFREVVRQSPEHFQARLYLAHCLLSDARMAEAEPELLVCRQLRPEAVEPLVGLASCAVERGDLNQAQSLLHKALVLDPTSTLVLNEQGELYLLRQRYDLAAVVFQEVVQRDPRDKRGHLRLAQVLRHNGDLERAREHARRFEELDREEERQSEQGGIR